MRADALERLCPCRSDWDVPVQRYVAAALDDPNPTVRHRARHALTEDSKWGRKLDDRRARKEAADPGEPDGMPGPRSLAWKTPKRPLVKGAAARLALHHFRK